jgi:hypothetical protein
LLLSLTTAALAAAVVYWPTLALPLIYDDLLHIQITRGLNWATVWLPTEAYGFYRPLIFAPLLAIHVLFGYYPGWLLHGLNVAQHAFNAALLAALIWRLWRNPLRALASGLLFALFPFSYQAVAVYGHNVHPALVGLLLAGLHAYLGALRSRGARWGALTGALFALSLLTHESAILFGAFAFLLETAERDARCRAAGRAPGWREFLAPRSLRPWMVFLALGGVFAIGYRLLLSPRRPQTAIEDGGLWMRALYLLQSAAHPFAWFGHLWRGLDASLIVLASIALTLALTAWAARQAENRAPLLLGWGWWALASALLAASLSTDYLLHGPRLLYVGSVGVAIGWAVLIESIGDSFRSPLGRLGWGLLLGFILITNWMFVRARLDDYARLTRPVGVIARDLSGRAPDAGALLVNLPQWLDPPANTYPVGVEFVSMLADYLFAEDLIAQNVGGARPVQAIRLPDLLAQTPYAYAVHDQTPLDALQWGRGGREWHVFVTRYDSSGPQTTHTGWLAPQPSDTTPLAAIGPYTLVRADAAACNGSTRIELIWRPSPTGADTPLTLSAFVHILDADRQMIAQADGPPLGLRPDLIPADPNLQLHDLRQADAGDAQPAQLRVGLYDYASGERLPARDPQQQPLPDDAVYAPVRACP